MAQLIWFYPKGNLNLKCKKLILQRKQSGRLRKGSSCKGCERNKREKLLIGETHGVSLLRRRSKSLPLWKKGSNTSLSRQESKRHYWLNALKSMKFQKFRVPLSNHMN
uniref:Uncharacterized protein n=1 Tax=Opuntia streptacantha TaxID=393608 RepID=A0A7C9A5Z1_OPUST